MRFNFLNPKTLKTALLEVLLIFIGITTAIWFDNWNEKQKLNQAEIVSLKEIHKELIETNQLIIQSLKSNERKYLSLQNLYEHFKNKRSYHDSLSFTLNNLMFFTSIYPPTSAYSNLKNTYGLNLITNNDLQRAIEKMYSNDIYLLTNDIDKFLWLNLQESTMPIFVKYFSFPDLETAIPNNYNALIRSQEFTNMITTNAYLLKKIVPIMKNVSKKLDELIVDIEAEIVQLQS